MDLQPFSLNIGSQDIQDLKERLQRTCWPGIRRQCSVPHGAALTTQAHERPPREYVERLFPNVIRWTDLQKGGLFVALEEPDAIVGFFSYALGLNHCAS